MHLDCRSTRSRKFWTFDIMRVQRQVVLDLIDLRLQLISESVHRIRDVFDDQLQKTCH